MEKLSSKKSRPWEIKDLYNRIASVRAVPILFLEKWEREKGSPGSDRMTTDEINNELVTRDILAKPMARKGVGNLVTGFCQKQRNRDLYPILVEPVDRGVWHFNMSHYETLLRDFRKRYPLMGTGTPPTQGMSHSLVGHGSESRRVRLTLFAMVQIFCAKDGLKLVILSAKTVFPDPYVKYGQPLSSESVNLT
jgi:hypothetical protein